MPEDKVPPKAKQGRRRSRNGHNRERSPHDPVARRMVKQHLVQSFGLMSSEKAKQRQDKLHQLYAPERHNIHDFAEALGQHVDLQADLRGYHDAYRYLQREWNHRNRTIETEARQERETVDQAQRNRNPSPVTPWRSPLDLQRMSAQIARGSALRDLSNRALLWLQYRYWRIATTGVSMLHLPPDWFGAAIKAVIDGGGYEPTWNEAKRCYEWGDFNSGWRHAITFLDGLPVRAIYDITHPLNVELVRTKDALHAYMDQWQKSDERDEEKELQNEGYPPRYAGLMLDWPPVYMTRDEYIDCAVKAIEDAWDRISSMPHARPYPGQRPLGRQQGGGAQGEEYIHPVNLYNFWHDNPVAFDKWTESWIGRKLITWDEFASKVIDRSNAGDLFDGWHVSGESTIRTSTKKAILLLAPDPEIPLCLADFTLDTPPPSDLLAHLPPTSP